MIRIWYVVCEVRVCMYICDVWYVCGLCVVMVHVVSMCLCLWYVCVWYVMYECVWYVYGM